MRVEPDEELELADEELEPADELELADEELELAGGELELEPLELEATPLAATGSPGVAPLPPQAVNKRKPLAITAATAQCRRTDCEFLILIRSLAALERIRHSIRPTVPSFAGIEFNERLSASSKQHRIESRNCLRAETCRDMRTAHDAA